MFAGSPARAWFAPLLYNPLDMFTIPTRLENLLKQDQHMHSCVVSTVSECQSALSIKSPTFFPEYTDHSMKHVQEVLQAADALVPEISRPHLTPSDAGILTISAILHDLAMHITEDGFVSLVTSPKHQHSATAIVPELDAKTWSELWEEF